MFFHFLKDKLRRDLLENLRQGFESLGMRSGRSLLTILGVFIGVVIIIAVASALNGFRQRVIDRFREFGANNIYVMRMPMLHMMRPGGDVRQRKYLTLEDAFAIRDECPAVEAVGPALWVMPDKATARYEGREMVGPNLRGVFPVMAEVLNLNIIAGRFFTAEENRSRVGVCIIGVNVVDALFGSQDALGKTILVKGKQFQVIGLVAKRLDAPFGGENPEDSMIFLPYYAFRDMFPEQRDHVIAARTREGEIDKAMDQIESVLRRRRHVAWNAPNDFEISTSNSIIATFDKIVFAALAVMFTLSTVAFLVGGVGVMNVMFASVKQRTREIGVRRALGARRRDIVAQFLFEAMIMTGTGGLLGVACGEALMWAVARLLPSLPVATPLWAELFGFFGSAAVGLVFGLWPAVVAARLDPIKALRYE
ncbi:MAG: ABC transporter permease [Candidatus Sumerlaeota bacterium]|nr:ABC transporter permease [Candidatus Sumerlaeota bacterium]